jgi:hypothetical protein
MNCFVIKRFFAGGWRFVDWTPFIPARTNFQAFFACLGHRGHCKLHWPAWRDSGTSVKFPGKLVAGMFSFGSEAFFRVPPPVKEALNLEFANP